MDELISRKAAIDAVLSEERYCERNMDGEATAVVRMARFKVEKVPVVDAAPVVHGRWVYEHGDPDMLPCSVCGYQVFRYNNTSFCPNCGAKMDGEQRIAFADQSGAEYADNPTV